MNTTDFPRLAARACLRDVPELPCDYERESRTQRRLLRWQRRVNAMFAVAVLLVIGVGLLEVAKRYI
jgi:hypothetical protein